LAAERENLAHKGFGAQTGIQNLFQVGAGDACRWNIFHGQFAATDNHA